MSIRLRFTLLYNAILAVTLALFGASLYAVFSFGTYDALQKDLKRSSQALGENILRAITDPNAGPVILPGANPYPRPFEEFSDTKPFRELREREMVRLLDWQGNLIVSPYGRSQDALPLSAEGLQTVQAQKEWWEVCEFNDQRMLVYNRPLLLDGKVIFILQTARSLTERERSLQFLAVTFGGASLLTILIAFGVGWVFSGVTLAPIKKLTHSAQVIGQERDFTRRVAYTGPHDEVGELAGTLNGMLARLQDAYQQVARSLEMQRNFVADVSHELRTPLTTLRGNLGLMGRQPPIPAEEQADIIHDMTEESDRLIRLVNDLLVLARADAGRSLAHDPLEVLPILEEARRMGYPDRAIRLEAAETGLRILGDRDAFKQILLIALDNALKHTAGEIILRALRRENHVEIQVCDLGPGIPPEKLEHIFERFYRGVDNATLPGFGLGLPIAKALTENMGGQIKMSSEIGQGSTLTLRFPSLA